MKKMDVMEKLASMKMYETDEHGNVKLLPLKLGLPSGSTKNVQQQSNPDRSSLVSKEPIKPLNIWDLNLHNDVNRNKTLVGQPKKVEAMKGVRKKLFRGLPQTIPTNRVSVNKLTFPVGRRSLTRSDKSKAPMSRPTKKNVRISTTVSQRDSPKLLSPEEPEQILSKVNSLKSAVKKMAILETVHENSPNVTANEQANTPNSHTNSIEELDEFLQLEHFAGGATTLSAKLKIILRNYEKQTTMLRREYQEASDRQYKDTVQKIMKLVDGDKENEKPTKNSIASCSKKSVDLRKTTLTKNSKAVELYNSLRMSTSVLGTPKFDNKQQGATPCASARKLLGRRVQNQCLRLQETPR